MNIIGSKQYFITSHIRSFFLKMCNKVVSYYTIKISKGTLVIYYFWKEYHILVTSTESITVFLTFNFQPQLPRG